MHYFFRLLSYTMRYKSRFFLGVAVSFLVAVLNSFTLAAFYPLFEALGKKEEKFSIQFSGRERRTINHFVLYNLAFAFHPERLPDYLAPPKPKKITQKRARNILFLLENYRGGQLQHAFLEQLQKKPKSAPKDLVALLALHKIFQGSRLSQIEELRLDTDIYWKLRLNAAGFQPNHVVWFACGIMFISYLLRLALLLVAVRLIAGSGYMAVHDIRHDLYTKMQKLPLSFFYQTKTGELVSRLINDVEVVAAVISSNMRDAITNIFYIVTCLFWLAYFNASLLVSIVVLIPVLLSPVTFFTRKIRKSVSRSQALMAGLNGHLNEAITGVKVIRAHSMEDYETARFRKVNDRLYWRTFKQNFYLKLGPYLVEFNSALLALGIIMVGALYLDPADFTGGQFIAFFVTLLFIIRPVIQLSGMFAKIQAAEAAGKRLFEIIDHEPESRDPEKPLPYKRMKDSVVFENVSFTYPGTDKEVLHNIQLEVRAGETIALVGESGGGKSTMMDLLARFFDPTNGRILIDGQDIRNFTVADHRRRLGIVTQDIFLFYGSIYQNIAYGSAHYDKHEVEKAARLAHAHDFIMEFYEGYNTLIGNRGMALSGGQRQRIAIARALLRDPEILILDEATSALDTESERLVQGALERLYKNRTTFIIAHRLSTIEKADRILVISEGQIAAEGTHEVLLKEDGLYARLQEISREMAQK